MPAGPWRMFVAMALGIGLLLGGNPPPASAATEPFGPMFRISFTGDDGDQFTFANQADLAYDFEHRRYLAVWTGAEVAADAEIHGQLLDEAGNRVGGELDISEADVGPSSQRRASNPAVTYNPDADEFLVVWRADDEAVADEEIEIFGQRLSATGAAVGADDFRISQVGVDGDPDFDANATDVTYNPAAGEYLVVWSANDGAPLADNELEIYGQRLTGAGAEVGTDDFRISQMGPDGQLKFPVTGPRVVHNPGANEYLVTWNGVDDAAGLAEGEFEVYGQRLSAAGAEVGTDDFRITQVGPDGEADFDVGFNAPAFNGATGEYLVAFSADTVVDGDRFTADHFEILARRVTGAGAPTGAHVQVSSAGPPTSEFGAFSPAVAPSDASGGWLVVWVGRDDRPGLAPEKAVAYGQELTSSGAQVGTDDFQISQNGANGDGSRGALRPAIAGGPAGSFMAVWDGDIPAPSVPPEADIFGRRLVPVAAGSPGPPPAAPFFPGFFLRDATAPRVVIVSRSLRLDRRRRLRLRLGCPRTEREPCRGTVTIRTAGRVRPGGGRRGRRRIVRLARAPLAIPPGANRTVRLRLSRRNALLVRRSRRLRVRVEAVARDRAGNRGVARRTLRLRPPRQRSSP